ncbi:lebercilin-like protein isoform X1 [Antechinus flavipes]|uniref:lebercilin-like protein isoform X1 n=1 Tax=Antechinus flavipes TaxID=38775 RepID=UPI0022358A13|nr:lebercilin-like protein isoform X1 [Antechinus flavipes]
MSLIDTTSVDDHFHHTVLEDKPTECKRNLGTGDFSRNSNNSTGSVDYSRTQGSSGNFSSHYDYSEDFVSEYSATAVNGSCVDLFETKVKKEEKKKKNVCNVAQQKGFKEISPEKLQNWNTALTSQISIITQKRDAMAHRIMSARLHKIKELKNELADIHRKLEATVLENQLLKRLQFRHLKAIGKYENSQNNLPQLMAKHHSEVKNLRQLLRKSQEKERNVSRKLRDTDSELLKTKDSLLTLQKLSEDKSLAEREELTQKLSALSTKMEANDKRIQSLERQLRLNSSAFSRQLAAENRKTITAKNTSKNLQMEVKCLQQKLKEKDRELDIRNIYTNRFLKNLYDKDEQLKGNHEKTTESFKVSSPTTSIKAEKKYRLFPCIVPHHLKENTEDSVSLLIKEEKATGNDAEKEETIHVSHEVIHDVYKLPNKEDPEKIYKDLLKEDIHREVQTPLESNGRQREKNFLEKIPNLLKEEQATSAQRERLITPLRENNHHLNVGKENLKISVSMHDTDELHNKYVIQNSKIPLRQRKHYSFTEAIENLHNGIPTSGTSSLGASRNSQIINKQQGNATDLKTENSVSRYEPSFGKSSKTKTKDSSSEKNGNCTNTALRDKKSNLMEELFGSDCVLKNNPTNTDLKSPNKEKESLESDRMQDPHNYRSSAINAFGDSKYATIIYNGLCQNSVRKNSFVRETDEGNLKRSNKTRK